MAKITNSNFTSIEDSCYTALTSVVSGVTAYLDMQNGVEPVTPYCHIFVVTETPTGMASESATVNKTTRITTMCQPYEALVRFVFVGKDKQSGGSDTNAANYAEDFSLKMQSVYYRALFADNGMSVLRVSPNRRSQQKRETDIYSVSTIDLSLAYDKHLTVTFDSIDDGNINGTLLHANNVSEYFGFLEDPDASALANLIGGYGGDYGEVYGESAIEGGGWLASFTATDICLQYAWH